MHSISWIVVKVFQSTPLSLYIYQTCLAFWMPSSPWYRLNFLLMSSRIHTLVLHFTCFTCSEMWNAWIIKRLSWFPCLLVFISSCSSPLFATLRQVIQFSFCFVQRAIIFVKHTMQMQINDYLFRRLLHKNYRSNNLYNNGLKQKLQRRLVILGASHSIHKYLKMNQDQIINIWTLVDKCYLVNDICDILIINYNVHSSKTSVCAYLFLPRSSYHNVLDEYKTFNCTFIMWRFRFIHFFFFAFFTCTIQCHLVVTLKFHFPFYMHRKSTLSEKQDNNGVKYVSTYHC